MTNKERWEFYESADFRQVVAIKLLDWAGYWATAGVDGIDNPLLKAQTKRAVNMVVTELGYVTGIVVSLAISDSSIVQAEEVSEEIIGSVVTSIMSYKLAWVTGIDTVN